jgi:Fibronectin type III domain.
MKRFLFFTAFLLDTLFASAQTTLTATGYNSYSYGSYCVPPNVSPPCVYNPVAVTFAIKTSNCPVILRKVGYSSYGTLQVRLFYSTTSISGPAGNVLNWTLLSTVPSTTVTYPTINDNFFSGMSLVIPAYTTYRFAVVADDNILMGNTQVVAGPGTVVGGGVTLDVSPSVSYWDGATIVNSTGFAFYGSITVDPVACVTPTGMAATNVGANSADLSWNAVPGSAGYEYFVDQNPTIVPPIVATSGTANSFTKTGLTAGTGYTLHVRNKCGTDDYSCWTDYSFTTKPPCKPPTTFTPKNLAPNAVDLTWTPWSTALSYDYLVDNNPSDPAGSTAISNTVPPNVIGYSGLTEGTKYYVHIRSVCDGNEVSDWMLDSFVTPIPCRQPVLQVSNINVDEAVVFWDDVNAAYQYEYALTSSATPPPNGTTIHDKAVLASALVDGKQYYMHVRTHCTSVSNDPKSQWATIGFRTFPVNVNDVDASFRFAAYPNPVKNTLNIMLDAGSKNGALYITDVTGKLLQRIDIQGTEMQLNMEGMSPGIYLLKYKDDTHDRTIKVVKQ